ncbi:MAG: hypothetical protein FJ095_16330 [Deltaproteobacteria bacterium]|nr:hypothetical protein [Deltaproteobacteria bacterium]
MNSRATSFLQGASVLLAACAAPAPATPSTPASFESVEPWGNVTVTTDPAATPQASFPCPPQPIALPQVALPPGLPRAPAASESTPAPQATSSPTLAEPGLTSTTPPATAARRHGNLLIPATPRARTHPTRGYVPTDTEGTFLASDERVWVGLPVPAYVPAGLEDLELSRLLETPDETLALYRNYYGHGAVPGCATVHRSDNCTYRARLYRKDGTLTSEIDFNGLMHQPEHLRVDHITLADGVLYYPQSCQSYAREAKRRCSDIVALDVKSTPTRVLWRSAFLMSNAEIVRVGEYLVTGYGFTAETDYLHALDARTGKLMARVVLPSAPEELRVNGAVLEVFVYGSDVPVRFAMKGFDEKPTPSKRPAFMRLR